MNTLQEISFSEEEHKKDTKQIVPVMTTSFTSNTISENIATETSSSEA
jgi:hypothetical protein